MLNYGTIKEKFNSDVTIHAEKGIEMRHSFRHNSPTGICSHAILVVDTNKVEPETNLPKVHYAGKYMVQALETFNQLTND